MDGLYCIVGWSPPLTKLRGPNEVVVENPRQSFKLPPLP